jgi:hypothetical protein
MNKRIKELAEECYEYDQSITGTGQRVFNQEKFAQLVIKETMSIVAKNISWNGYLEAVEAVHTQLGVDRSIN